MNSRSLLLIVTLVLLSAWTLLYRLGEPAFYHIRKESRRALIVREMVQNRNWLVPSLERAPTLTKPPLYYWSAALLSLKNGVTEKSARLPSAAAGVGTVVFTFLLGSLLAGRRAGFLSALALLVTNFFIHEARYAEMESMLTFFTTGSVYCFFRGYRNPRRAAFWYGAFFFMAGLGMITKGPFALTFPLVPIIAWLWIYGEKKLLLQKPFLRGAVFFLAVTLPWPIAVTLGHPVFIPLIVRETIGRAVTGYVHAKPFYYYLTKLDETLFPWVFFLPFSIWIVYTQKLAAQKKQNVFVLLWFLGNLLFLSLLRSKRDYYLFPAAPAAALLIGATWEPLWGWIAEKVKAKAFLNARAVLVAGALLAVASGFAGNPLSLNFPELDFPAAAPFLLFSGLCLCASAGARIIRPGLPLGGTVFCVVVAAMLASHYVYFTYSVPTRNTSGSGKHFYRDAARTAGREAPLAFFGSNENYTFEFYAGRPIETIRKMEALDAFMAGNGLRYVAMTGRKYRKLDRRPWRVVLSSDAAERKACEGYVLLGNNSNHPPAEGGIKKPLQIL